MFFLCVMCCLSWYVLFISRVGAPGCIIFRAKQSQDEMEQAYQVLSESSKTGMKTSKEFNTAMFSIFQSWAGDEKCEIEKGKKMTFEEVMASTAAGPEAAQEPHGKKLHWLGVCAEVKDLESWASLHKHASTVLGQATEKQDLENKVKASKENHNIAFTHPPAHTHTFTHIHTRAHTHMHLRSFVPPSLGVPE